MQSFIGRAVLDLFDENKLTTEAVVSLLRAQNGLILAYDLLTNDVIDYPEVLPALVQIFSERSNQRSEEWLIRRVWNDEIFFSKSRSLALRVLMALDSERYVYMVREIFRTNNPYVMSGALMVVRDHGLLEFFEPVLRYGQSIDVQHRVTELSLVVQTLAVLIPKYPFGWEDGVKFIGSMLKESFNFSVVQTVVACSLDLYRSLSIDNRVLLVASVQDAVATQARNSPLGIKQLPLLIARNQCRWLCPLIFRVRVGIKQVPLLMWLLDRPWK